MGKSVVYLPQCHSTNDELSNLAKKSDIKEGTVLYTGYQTKGKGQRGNKWVAEPHKNVLMSIFLRPGKIKLSNQYFLNLIIGLAAIEVLDQLVDTPKYLKWPNDIYIRENKIGGSLIESSVKEKNLETVVVGIGLNVNQNGIPVPKATSIFLETNRFYDIEDVIEKLLCKIEEWYDKLLREDFLEIKSQYYQRLMWFNDIHEYESDSVRFKGKITGIDEYGRLLVETINGLRRTFRIKEVEFIK
ncbi:MAG: biotin--[acetyl-CoA-carboxylase] ligase [Ekhidna sp.]|nr:biotin--[acetyl-CoA-carboxylase] ligase [Ekhidna sp.]MBC6408962.1 biotin--[acetyl-CoA-carboxylase] ligase [Ekhidna sp.]MBC6427349.1 biotin--[acetyl-CoA-carboxylase] ligase [Ekhidna sp.]